jgi:hypothetical protein
LGLGQWGEVEKSRGMTREKKTRKEKIQRRGAECAEVAQRIKERNKAGLTPEWSTVAARLVVTANSCKR